MSESFEETLLVDLRELLGVISRGLDDNELRRMLATIGWDLDAITGLPLERVRDALRALDTALNGLPATTPRNLTELGTLLEAADAAFEAIAAFNALVTTPPDSRLAELGRDLLSHAVTTYLFLQHPVLFRVLVLLTVIEPTDIDLVVDSQDPQKLLRLPNRRPVFRAAQIPALFRDPVGVLETEYLGPAGTPPRDNPFNTKEDARLLSNKLFPRISALLNEMGVPASYGVRDYGQDFGAGGNDVAARTLTVLFSSDVQPTVATMSGISGVLLSREESDLGLVITPFGSVAFTRFVGDWRLTWTLSADVPGFSVGRPGLKVQSSAPLPSRIDASVAALRLPGDGTPEGGPLVFRIGGETGTRFEVGAFGVNVHGGFEGQSRDFGFLLSAESCALIVDSGDGDGFVGKLLGANPLRLEFSLAGGWSRSRGLTFRGAGALEVELPVTISIAGVVDVLGIRARIAAEEAIDLEVSAKVEAHLGPVTVVVDRVGLASHVTFPGEKGNLGPLDASLDFKHPSGVGLDIDAGPISGGGFIGFANGRYFGGLELRIYEITVTAFGIIDTKLPDGRRGFSFVILISAEFQPIQLGLGFTLNGVGGVLAINRTVSTEGLDKVFASKTLDAILFPRDVVQRAPEIIEALQTVFPPAEDHQVFGPMAKIGWGTPTLVTADLALLLNLPERVLRVLGLVRADLPRKKQEDARALVSLRMAVKGELDFPNKRFALDAFLHDSTIGGFVVSGDMAMRLSWGDRPNFLLSLGGFHKDYTPPSNFPALNRLAVELGINGNPTITLSGYLAVTSNTVQVGGSLRFVASKAHFEIGASVSADAIFVFSPFSFTATLDADVHLTFHDVGFTVRLHGKLSGPSPWRIEAKVCASLWFVSACLSFSETIGTPDEDALPSLDPWVGSEEPDVAARTVIGLRDSLQDPRNWAPLPGAGSVAVVSRADPPLVDGDQVTAVDPLDAITVHQRVVPLETHPGAPITRFGPVKSSGTPRYHLEEATVGEARHPLLSNANLTDYFAPAQYFELDEKKVFSAPAFERRTAGYTFEVSGDLRFGSTETQSDVTFETFVIDTKKPVPRPGLNRRLDLDLLNGMLRMGAAAVGGVTFRGEGAFLDPLALPRFGLRDPTYVVTDRTAQQPAGVVDTPVSKTEALIILESHLAQNPVDRGRLQVSRSEVLAP